MANERIKRLLHIRKLQELRSAQQLKLRQAQHQQAQEQVSQLSGFVAEYAKSPVVRNARSAHQLLQFQNFYRQLQVTVETQKHLVEQHRLAVRQVLSHHLRRRLDTKSLDVVLAQRELDHKKGVNKKARKANIPQRLQLGGLSLKR